MGRHFPVREKWGNFEQTGKVREYHTKYWKIQEFQTNIICYFSAIFKWTVSYLLKWIRFSVLKKNKTLKKILENGKKIMEKSGKILSVQKSGKPCLRDVFIATKMGFLGYQCRGRRGWYLHLYPREHIFVATKIAIAPCDNPLLIAEI